MFSVTKLQIARGSTTANGQGGGITTVTHSYKDLDLTVAAITMLLPPFLGQGIGQEFIFVGDHILIEGSDTSTYNRILSLNPFTMGADYFSGASGLSVAPPIVAVDNNGAIITGEIFQLEKADQTHPGILTEVAQDIGGIKTFHADVNIVNPTTGLNITEAAGGVGVNITTANSANAAGFTIADSALSSNIYGMVFKGDGFTSANPQLWIIADTGNAGVMLDNIDQSVTINNKLITASIVGNANLSILAAQIDFNNSPVINFPALPGTNYTIGAPIASVDTNGLLINNTASTLQAEIADATHPGIVTSGAQILGGTKSFPDGIVANGTNYAVAAPIAPTDSNALIINNVLNTIELENADLTHPGIVSTAAQSFGGTKTFTAIVAPGANYSTGAPVVASDANALIINNTTNVIQGQISDATHPGIITAVAQTFGGAKSFAGGVLSNAVDTISAVPLVLGTATATAITLSQNSTVSSGKTLNTNTLDATSAGTLAIGTTTATAITLAKNTTVTAGQLFKANSIDAATAGALSIAPTTATSVTIGQSTALAAAKIFTADIIDATTAGALSIAPTTATSVTIAQNTTLSAGKILKADTLDATTAGALAIGTTTATAITLAKSTTVTSGQLFKASSIDASTAAPLVLAPTTATAITLSQDTTVTSGKLLKASSVDASTAAPLVLGATTATAITLSQDTTVTSGKLFKASSIDASTAVPLVLAPTTGTAITLSQDTTVTSGKLFKASSIDSSTAVALVLAPTTGTAITLSQDTTVSSGKVLKTNTLDATTAGALSIGTTTATSISLTQNTTLTAAKTFKADIIDATTAGALSIAPTVATSVTIAQNTTISAAKTLKADIIDATTAGALTIAPTVATSVKVTPLVMLTSAGMQFSQTASDPNQSIIKDYVEDTHSTTFTNNTLTTGTLVVTIRRVGKLVTIFFPAGSVGAQAAPASFVMNTVLVSKYRPIANISYLMRTTGAAVTSGVAILGTAGNMNIYYLPDGSNFTAGVTAAWDGFAITYPVA